MINIANSIKSLKKWETCLLCTFASKSKEILNKNLKLKWEYFFDGHVNYIELIN
jgi:hypothetical protein